MILISGIASSLGSTHQRVSVAYAALNTSSTLPIIVVTWFITSTLFISIFIITVIAIVSGILLLTIFLMIVYISIT